MWMMTIQRDLKSNNLSLNETIDVAQNCPLWRLMSIVGTMHSVVHARNDDKIKTQNYRHCSKSFNRSITTPLEAVNFVYI